MQKNYTSLVLEEIHKGRNTEKAVRLKQSTLTFSEQNTYSSTSGESSQPIYKLQVFLTKVCT